MTVKLPGNRGRIFHVPKGVAYKIEDSPLGIRIAQMLGFRWIDLDFNITADNVVVCGHWPRVGKERMVLPPWFVKKYGHDPMVEQVHWADLKQLTTEPLAYKGKSYKLRYYSVGEIFYYLLKYPKLGVSMEVKDDARFGTDAIWLAIDQSRQRVGLPKSRVQVMTLSDYGWHPNLRLRFAKKHGYPTIILARGVIPISWEPDIDYVRGKWIRG